MKLNTRLFDYFFSVFKETNKKLRYFQIHFSFALFYLFLGFLFGNLFGSFLSALRKIIIWDGFIIFILIAYIEIISYLIYSSSNRPFLYIYKFSFSFKNNLFLKILNYFKIGIMLGFFIDAFKVGS